MKLVFMWIQWSWKWTQARLLEEKYGFKIFWIGDALREVAKEDTEFWKLVNKTIKSWKLVEPYIVEKILKDYVNKNYYEKIIFDGLVRNIWNKNTADIILKDYTVVFFDLPQIESNKRLLGRVMNLRTWKTFPAWTIVDPDTWDLLEKRSDDDESVIKKRIEEFFNKTFPMVDIYKKQWNLVEINANNSIEDVFKELELKLWLK